MNANLFRPSAIVLQPFWEQVTYYPKLAPGNEPSQGYILYRAKREDIAKRDTDPALKAYNVTWLLFRTDLEQAGRQVNPPVTLTPKLKDVIQDGGGTRWTVMKVDTELVQNEYTLETLREVG